MFLTVLGKYLEVELVAGKFVGLAKCFSKMTMPFKISTNNKGKF
jgi:hypothetical protein